MTPLARGALLVGSGLLVWLALDLLLMLFAGVLLAIFLRALATFVARVTGLAVGRALAVVCLMLVALLVGFGVLYAPNLARQSDQLTQALPKAAADLTSWLGQYGWGQWLVEQFSSQPTDTGAATRATNVLRRAIDGVVAFAVILFTGVYLAAQPAPYLRGVLHLVPRRHRLRAAQTVYAVGHVLRWWLVGQALAMALVGLAMGIGLSIIGVQFAFALGVLAGMFEFIPFVGPVLALGPALLIALASGTQQAAWVLGLYVIVQTLEGYVLTPLVQQRAVELPPVITIAAQLALSWAAGPIGLIVAVPLTAAVMVIVQMLYVEDRLRDDVASEFEAQAEREVEEERDRTLRGVLPPHEVPPPEAGLEGGKQHARRWGG